MNKYSLLRIAVISFFLFPLISNAAPVPATCDMSHYPERGCFSIAGGDYFAPFQNPTLICGPPAVVQSCKNPDSTNIPLVAAGNTLQVNLNAVQQAIFPNEPKCPVTSSCVFSAEIAGQQTPVANFTLNVKLSIDGKGNLVWNGNMTNTTSAQPTQLYVLSQESNPVPSGYNLMNLQLYAVEQGTITLANDVAKPPAILTCSQKNASFTALRDPTTGNEYFDFATMFNAVAPNTAPTSLTALTGCTLKDSEKVPTTYATIKAINKFGSHVLDTTDNIWAAEITDENFIMAPGDNIVTKSQTNPATDDTSAYNQYTINIAPISAGSINLAGAIRNYPGDLSLTCDKAPAFKLPRNTFTFDLNTLHGAGSGPDVAVNYTTCTLSGTNSGTTVTFASFSISNIGGQYYTAAGTSPMWAATVSNVAEGTSVYSVDTTPVASVCDYQNPNACNQITLNFYAQKPGNIDILNISNPSSSYLLCTGGQKYTGQILTANSVRFNMQTLHDSVAPNPNTNVDLTKCYLYVNNIIEGVLDITGINGIRYEAVNPQAQMWSATIPASSLSGLTVESSTTCDTTGAYCNDWQLQDTV